MEYRIVLNRMEFRASTAVTTWNSKWATASRSIWRSRPSWGKWRARTGVEKAVNYLLVYETVREQMRVTQRTIERVSMNIMDALYARFPQIRHIRCTVSKLAPPLGGKLEK